MKLELELINANEFIEDITKDIIKDDVNEVVVGLFGEQGSDLVQYATDNEFGSDKIPPRSFIRWTITENEDLIFNFIESGYGKILNNELTKKEMLEQLGLLIQMKIQERITLLRYPPNAPATIKKKKSSNPLIDTGRMRQSITYKVGKFKDD